MSVNYKIVASLKTYFDNVGAKMTQTSPASGDIELTDDGATAISDLHRAITANETEAVALDSELATAFTDTNNENNVEIP